MLDENIENPNSENLTDKNTTSNSETDNSELTEDRVNQNNQEQTDNSEAKVVAEDTVEKIDEVVDHSNEENVAVVEEVVIEEKETKEKPVVEEVVVEEKEAKEKPVVEEVVVEEKEAKEEPVVEEVVIEEKETKEELAVEEVVVDEKETKEEPVVEEVVVEKKETKEKPVVEEVVLKEKEVKEPIVAEKSTVKEKETKDETKAIEEKVEEKIDFDSLDLEGLVKAFQQLLKQGVIPNVKNDIEKIKLIFNQKFGELLKEKKAAFLAEGGNEIDFHYSSPIKSVYNDLLFEFKTKRQQHYKQIEEEQKENLSIRLTLIDELKHLIDNAEPSTMYSQFKKLQDKWRSSGNIPRGKYNDTWRTYHHHVERFYDLLHLSNDLRDLDFKHNLEEKLKLVEQAEELAENKDTNKAFKGLQVLHRLWKEDIGPVDREHREEIWDRFSNATKKIHERRHELQKDLESKFEDNVIIKREVINNITNIITDKIESHKVWQQKIKELEILRQEFFKIGRVPRALNDKVWDEFKEATRNFNKSKNIFYKSIKKDQHENLNKKNALVEKAEALKDSDDWDTTTEIMKQIQAEWRTIGHVPRKYSDKIWKRFKDACNYYFDRLHGVQDEANKDQIDAFNKKKELLENLKDEANKDEPLTLEAINSLAANWQKLGILPNNMRHIEAKFNKTLNSLYSKLNLDEKEISMLKFKNIINNYLNKNDLRKLDNEQLFIRKKIDEVTKEIQQLENNISFISNADDDNPLLMNVRNNIENYNKQLGIWKTKLGYITSLDY